MLRGTGFSLLDISLIPPCPCFPQRPAVVSFRAFDYDEKKYASAIGSERRKFAPPPPQQIAALNSTFVKATIQFFACLFLSERLFSTLSYSFVRRSVSTTITISLSSNLLIFFVLSCNMSTICLSMSFDRYVPSAPYSVFLLFAVCLCLVSYMCVSPPNCLALSCLPFCPCPQVIF